jgi:glycosyltransferase involved in cell wall biosynthesis
MSNPDVTVLLCVYNDERFLEAALAGLVAQTFRNFELLVVNDASTDRTPRILDDFARRDRRVRVHANDANLGLTRSLNVGLSLARGRYIARHDSDDVSSPDRIARQYKRLRDDPSLGLVGSAYRVVDARGRSLAVHRQPVEDSEIRWQLLFHNAFCHSSVMARRDVIERVGGYDERLVCAQDFDLWVRVSRAARCANLLRPLVAFRTNDAGVSATRRTLQQHTADRIAARQIAALTPNLEWTPNEIRTLRDWFYAFPERLAFHERPLAQKLSSLVDAFAAQDAVDPRFAARLKRTWSRRIESAVGPDAPASSRLARRVRSILAGLTQLGKPRLGGAARP